jgi:hypothetical protein
MSYPNATWERAWGAKPKAARTSPDDSGPYNGLKLPFCATLGQEPELEMAVV